MAIQWGGTSGYLQLGIDVLSSPGSVGPRTQSVTLTVVYYIRAAGYGHNFSDTLRLGGRISGSQGYSFSSPRDGWTTKEIARRSVTVTTAMSRQTVTFSASTGPVWNGGTPSVSRSHVIGARGYAPPRPPRDPLAAWQRDGLTRVSWAGDYDSASGLQPWSGVSIRRWKLSEKRWEYVARVPWHVKTWDDVNAPLGEHTEYDVQAYNDAGWSPIVWAGPVNTRPDPPTGVRAVKRPDGIIVTWDVPDYGGYYTSFDVYDNGAKVGTTSAREFLHVGVSDSTHQYTVVAATKNDPVHTVQAGLELKSRHSEPSNRVSILAAPNAPTPMFPVGQTVRSGKNGLELRWTHNAADSSEQTFYEVRYKENGSEWKKTGITRANRSAHVLALGIVQGTVTWTVRTWGAYKPGAAEGASPWSPTVTFTLEPAGNISIATPPVGAVHNRPDVEVAWDYDLTASDATVEVRRAEPPVPGRAGTAFTTVWEKTYTDPAVINGSRRVRTPRILKNGEEYYAVVTATPPSGERDTTWPSGVAEPRTGKFSVRFPEVPKPIVALTWDDQTGAVTIQITNPDEGTDSSGAHNPKVYRNDVYRRLPSSPDWEEVALDVSPQGTVQDYEAAIGSWTRYKVIASTELGSSEGDAQIRAESEYVWLGAGDSYASSIKLAYNVEITENVERADAEAFRFAGRPKRVIVEGTGINRSWSVRTRLVPPRTSTPDEVAELAAETGAVLFRTPDGVVARTLMKGVSVSRGAGGKFYDASFELTEVE